MDLPIKNGEIVKINGEIVITHWFTIVILPITSPEGKKKVKWFNIFSKSPKISGYFRWIMTGFSPLPVFQMDQTWGNVAKKSQEPA